MDCLLPFQQVFFSVRFANATSHALVKASGVSRRAILSPLLFILYTKEFPSLLAMDLRVRVVSYQVWNPFICKESRAIEEAQMFRVFYSTDIFRILGILRIFRLKSQVTKIESA